MKTDVLESLLYYLHVQFCIKLGTNTKFLRALYKVKITVYFSNLKIN